MKFRSIIAGPGLALVTAPGAQAETWKLAVTDVEGMERKQVELGPFKDALETATGESLVFLGVSLRTAATEAARVVRTAILEDRAAIVPGIGPGEPHRDRASERQGKTPHHRRPVMTRTDTPHDHWNTEGANIKADRQWRMPEGDVMRWAETLAPVSGFEILWPEQREHEKPGSWRRRWSTCTATPLNGR